MPNSPCFYAIRNFEHHDFWVWSAGYTCVYIFLAIVSTIILWSSGSTRLSRLLTWIATWDCFKCLYGTPLTELLSLMMWVLTLSPTCVLTVWTIKTYDYDFTYTGETIIGDIDHIGIQQGEQFTNCKTLTSAVAFLAMSVETARIAGTLWSFRRWLLPFTTGLMFAASGLCFWGYMFMMIQVVRYNDDLMAAIVFLSASAIPMLRIIFAYYDDLAIDLNDYLYGVRHEVSYGVKGKDDQSVEVLSKAAKGQRFETHDSRWGIMTYAMYLLVVYAVYLGYALSSTWIHARDTAPGYVLPYIVIVDTSVLFMMGHHRLRHMWEPLSSLGLVVGLRVVVVYLAWFDRDSEKPGAYELVEPVIYMLCGCALSGMLASKYWEIPDTNTEKVVTSNRYDAWLRRQRNLVQRQRIKAVKNSCCGVIWSAIFCCLECFKTVCCINNNLGTASKEEEIETRINRHQWEVEKYDDIILDCEKELLSEICVLSTIPDWDKGRHEDKQAKDRKGKFKTPLNGDQLEYTREWQAKHTSLRRWEVASIVCLTFWRFIVVYKNLAILTLAHAILAIVFWYKEMAVVRKVFPFGNISTNNYYFEVMVYVGGFWIWSFAHGAMSTMRSLKEDQDDAREEIGIVISKEDSLPTKCSSNCTNFRPRPLSFQHGLAIDAIEKETDVETAIQKASEAGRGMLSSEIGKVAGEAAALTATRQWKPLLTAWSASLRSREPLKFEDLKEHTKGIVSYTRDTIFLDEEYTKVLWHFQEEDEEIDAERKAINQLIILMCDDGVRKIAEIACNAARDKYCDRDEQIAAAIKAAEISYAYFSVKNVALKPLSHFTSEVAIKVTAGGIPLNTRQLKGALHSETKFLGYSRAREIRDIAHDLSRWPTSHGGLNSKRKNVNQYNIKAHIALGLGIWSCCVGGCLSIFLGIVMREYELNNDDHESIYFFGNWIDVQRLFIYSIFLPLLTITLVGVFQSWRRNNFYFFNSKASRNGELYAFYKAGLMSRRDLTNIQFTFAGFIILFAWGITVAATYSETEGLAILMIGVALTTSIPPIMRGVVHRNAHSFLKGPFISGICVCAIINIAWYSVMETFIMPICTGVYYTLVWGYILLKQSQMVGFSEVSFLATTKASWILPVGVTMVCCYKEWTRRNALEGTESKGYVALVLVGFCALFGSMGVFFVLARRRIARRLREDKEAKLNSGETNTQDSALDHMGCCYHFVLWIKQQGETIAMVVIFVVLHVLAGVGMWALIKDKEDKGIVYASSEKLFAYGSALLGTTWALVFGSGFLSQTDGWAVTSDLLLPVVIPGQDFKNDRKHDFSEPVSTHNDPFGCVLLAFIIVMAWGMLATICPDVDFLFGRHQLAVGIAAIAWSILCGIVYPIYKQLWLNYQLHLNFQYFVSKPTIMAPVEYVDEKLQEVYEEKKKLQKLDAQAKEAAKAKEAEAKVALETAQHKLAEAQEATEVQAAKAATRAWETWHKAVVATLDWDDDDLTFEHIFVIATEAFGKCYSTTDHPLNSQKAVQDYSLANKQGKSGRCHYDNMMVGIAQYFWDSSDNSEPNKTGAEIEAAKQAKDFKLVSELKAILAGPVKDRAYTFAEFAAFFKGFVLDLGQLTYDEGFLSEKRNQAIRELATFRDTVTRIKANKCIDLDPLTAPSLFLQLEAQDYPKAMSTLCPCQQCWNCHCRKYEGDTVSRSDRRDVFKQIFQEEKNGIQLGFEKNSFEAHFLLSVAVTADMAKTVEQIAYFALRSGLVDEDEAENSEADGAAGEDTNVGLDKPPVEAFSNPIAMSVMDTAELRDDKHKRGQRERTDIFLKPGGTRETEYPDGDWADRVKLAQQHLSSVTFKIGDMYYALEFMSEYLAKKCRPLSQDNNLGTRQIQQVEILKEKEWDTIFGNVSTSSTVLDVFETTKSMKLAWDKVFGVTDPDNNFVPGCFDKLESPLTYSAAIIMQYYNVPMFVSMFSSGELRYNTYAETRDSSVAFRVYTDKMTTAAKDHDNQFADEKPRKAFTQLFQAPGSYMMEAFEEACHAMAGGSKPERGPAMLHEAYLLLKAEAWYETFFHFMSAGGQVSKEDLDSWLNRLLTQDPDLWKLAKGDRNFTFKDKASLSKQEFTKLHWNIVYPTRKYTQGLLCINEANWDEFDTMLESAKKEFFAHTIQGRLTPSEAEKVFQNQLNKSANYKLFKFVEEFTNSVDEMFDRCFYFRTGSYLRRFRHEEDAIQLEPTEQMYRNDAKTLEDYLNSNAMTNLLELKFNDKFGYCMDNKKYLQALLNLLQEDPKIRRDYAALYRVSRHLDYSKTDGDADSGKSQKIQKMKQQVITQLGNALGCDIVEERQIKLANRIVYPTQECADNTHQHEGSSFHPQHVEVIHVFEDTPLGEHIIGEHNKDTQGARDPQMSTSHRDTLEAPAQINTVDASAGQGSGNGIDLGSGSGSGSSHVIDFADQDNGESSFFEKMNLQLLDTMLVGTRNIEINFGAANTGDALRQTDNQLHNQDGADSEGRVSMDLSARDTSAKELNTNGTNLALDVIRTCMVFPLTVVNEIEVDYLVLPENIPKLPNHKVILIEGYRLIQGVKTKQTCIIAAMDKERHKDLLLTLYKDVRAENPDMNDQAKTMSKSWSAESSSKSSAIPTMGGNMVPQM